MAIPIALLYFVRRRKDVPFSWLFVMFGAFIVACGLTHLIDVVTFYHPMYRAAGLMKLITAVISLVTVAALVPILPKALALPGLARLAGELQREMDRGRVATRELEQERSRLDVEVAQRRKAEAHFRRAVEASPNAMLMTDAAGRVVMINEQAERLFGFTWQEILGRPVTILIPQSAAVDAAAPGWPDGRGPGRPGREAEARHRSGRSFPALVASNTIEDEESAMTISAIIDITERKASEAAILDSEARMRAILETAVDAIITIDEHGIIESVNRAGLAMFGYAREELVGSNVSRLMPPPFCDEHDRYLMNYVHGGRAQIIGIGREVVGLRRDRSTFPLDLAVSEVLLGGRRMFTGVVRDISERKRSETELSRQAEELRVQNMQLAEVNTELARMNSELDAFSYVASHDLQEPLRKLQSFSNLLEADLGDALPPDAEKDLYYIKDAAQRMQTLVRDLLDLSTAGNSSIRSETVDLELCVGEAIAAVAAAVQEKRATVKRSGLPCIEGDARLIRQVLQNLISNALKFVSPGTDPLVEITAESTPRGWVFGVLDNGIGVPSAHCESIFAPFKRLHGRAQYSGTGIGLAICRRAVERQGGSIWVEAAPGGGSHFRFTIGVTREAVHA